MNGWASIIVTTNEQEKGLRRRLMKQIRYFFLHFTTSHFSPPIFSPYFHSPPLVSGTQSCPFIGFCEKGVTIRNLLFPCVQKNFRAGINRCPLFSASLLYCPRVQPERVVVRLRPYRWCNMNDEIQNNHRVLLPHTCTPKTIEFPMYRDRQRVRCTMGPNRERFECVVKSILVENEIYRKKTSSPPPSPPKSNLSFQIARYMRKKSHPQDIIDSILH